MNPVATRIQALLDQRGEKLKPVAEACEVSYYSVYPWWQREHSKADYEKVKAFAVYFSVSPEHLMYGDPISETNPSAEVQEIQSLWRQLKPQEREFLRNAAKAQIAARGQSPEQSDED